MGKGAGVRTASKSSIEIDFYYKGVRCRERIALEPTPANLKAAAKLKARIDHEIAHNEFDYAKHFPKSPRPKRIARLPGPTLLIGDYLESWLTAEASRLKPSTLLGYQKILKYHLKPAFGTREMGSLKRKDLFLWADKHPKLSGKRIRNILSPLRIALAAAVERDLIVSTPFHDFRLKKRKKVAVDVDPLSAEERAAILGKLEGQNRNLVEFAFWTGLRTSELCALDWTDIDWIKEVIVVSKAMTQGMTKPERGTKTSAGLREVKLLAPALEALRAQKVHTFIKGEEVFQRPSTGERWSGDQALRHRMWIPALKRAGVRYRNPYQTRHTYATMMLMAGEHVMWVAKQMGHSDWGLTAKRYSRWIPSDMPDAGQKAVNAWSAFGQHKAQVV